MLGPEHHFQRGQEEGAVGPARYAPRHAIGAAGIERGFGEAFLKRAGDAQAVAEYVGADLHHRREAVTTGQWHQVRLGRQARDLDGSPIQPLDAQNDANLLRNRRLRIVVQDNVWYGVFLRRPNSDSMIFAYPSTAPGRRREAG